MSLRELPIPDPSDWNSPSNLSRSHQDISDVVADRAYTNKRQSFVRPLHQMGINVTMDYTTTEINNPKFIKAGTNGQRLLNSTGTLLPPWIPEYMHIPPANAPNPKT